MNKPRDTLIKISYAVQSTGKLVTRHCLMVGDDWLYAAELRHHPQHSPPLVTVEEETELPVREEALLTELLRIYSGKRSFTLIPWGKRVEEARGLGEVINAAEYPFARFYEVSRGHGFISVYEIKEGASFPFPG